MKSHVFHCENGEKRLMRLHFRTCLVWLMLWFVAGWPCLAADWPMQRHDGRRSAYTDESLAFPLQPTWFYQAAQPPAPAWPDTLELTQAVVDKIIAREMPPRFAVKTQL